MRKLGSTDVILTAENRLPIEYGFQQLINMLSLLRIKKKI